LGTISPGSHEEGDDRINESKQSMSWTEEGDYRQTSDKHFPGSGCDQCIGIAAAWYLLKGMDLAVGNYLGFGAMNQSRRDIKGPRVMLSGGQAAPFVRTAIHDFPCIKGRRPVFPWIGHEQWMLS
jgi:hypothetical protein